MGLMLVGFFAFYTWQSYGPYPICFAKGRPLSDREYVELTLGELMRSDPQMELGDGENTPSAYFESHPHSVNVERYGGFLFERGFLSRVAVEVSGKYARYGGTKYIFIVARDACGARVEYTGMAE
jgi:hypothetical protein